jgi:hypothetical protein
LARQWLLLNRREQFNPDSPGTHRLWLSVGGSTGVAKLWAVDVEEGELREDFTGRRWDVSVKAAHEAIDERCQGEDELREDKKEQERKADGTKVLNAIDRLVQLKKGSNEGVVKRSEVQHQAGISDARMDRAVNDLIGEGIIVEQEFIVKTGRNHKVSRTIAGLRRKSTP